MKRKIKKIFFEVISNFKIFNIKFCSMKLPTTKIFLNLHGGLDKGGLDNIEYDIIKTKSFVMTSSFPGDMRS